MKSFLIVLISLVTSISCQVQQEVTQASTWEERAARVTIIRDQYGVPHIYGKTDADAVFGMLYAQCEDDFPRVEKNYYWAIGRMAEVEGEAALYSDLRAKLYMSEAEAKAAYAQAPDWLQKLCEAYADGINYYLETHPQVQPKLLTHFEPWYPMYFFEGSIGGDIESVSTRRIREFYEGKASVPEAAVHEKEPRGSNGIALAGKLTASGNPILLINPHTSFYFRGESQVVSEEGLNAYGATTWGQFFIYQGFNEHTGWMHTSTRVDFMDDFLETIEERAGTLYYKYGDAWREVMVDSTVLKYKSGNQILEKKFPVYRTHHGPITGQINGQWVATKLNWEPVDALRQSFLRTKTKNHQEFWEMMKIRRNSSNNTVFADAEGNIAYYHGNFIPVRDTLFDFSQPVNGSDPATDWKGMHTLADIITIVNPKNGWLQNCNSTPFTAAGSYSPAATDYPHYMAPDEENYRAVHAIRLLDTARDMTLDKLITLAYDPYLPAFEKLIPGLLTAYDHNKAKYPQLKEAIHVLADWSFQTLEASIAMTLAHFYGLAHYRAGQYPSDLSGMERIEYFSKVTPEIDRLAIFQQVLEQLTQDFGTWQIPWGEVNRFQRLSGDIDLTYDDDQPSVPIGLASGHWGALASFGAKAHGTNRIYGSAGNSFVAVVEFGDSIQAKSLLAGGQSSDPNSQHFDDQIELYRKHQFKQVLFYKKDVEAQAQATYHPGQRAIKN